MFDVPDRRRVLYPMADFCPSSRLVLSLNGERRPCAVLDHEPGATAVATRACSRAAGEVYPQSLILWLPRASETCLVSMFRSRMIMPAAVAARCGRCLPPNGGRQMADHFRRVEPDQAGLHRVRDPSARPSSPVHT